MDRLPIELLHMIMSYLDKGTIINVGRSRSTLYPLALDLLYSNIEFRVDPFTGNLSVQSLRLLRSLYNMQKIGNVLYEPIKFTKGILVTLYPRSYFPITLHSARTLWSVFFLLLQNQYLRLNLQALQIRIGRFDDSDRLALSIPTRIQVLDLSACHIPTSTTYPYLKGLTLRHMSGLEAAWVRQQMRRSALQHIHLSGGNGREFLPVSIYFPNAEESATALEKLELEYMNLDSWPPTVKSCLRLLSLRYCSDSIDLYSSHRESLVGLTSFTLVTDQDIPDAHTRGLRRFLQSSTKLKRLTLLLGGRTSNIPLDWILPSQSPLKVLILESRQFLFAPAAIFRYSLCDMRAILEQIPELEMLGIAINIHDLQAVSVVIIE